MSEVTEIKVSKSQQVLDTQLNAVLAEAGPDDRANAAEILSSNAVMREVEITPAVGAIIFLEHNKRNRDLTFSKVYEFAEAMKRGEWCLHHQGIAAYPDGSLADGQHRMAAVAIAGIPQKFPMYPNFDKNAVDVIDRSKRRSAAEGLTLLGIPDAKIKASISKTSLDYIYEVQHGRIKRPVYSDPQIEQFVTANDAIVSQATSIGKQSTKNVSEPCMSEAEASSIVLLMLAGHWEAHIVGSYVSSIQQGVAAYTDSPTVYLARIFLKAKISERAKDRMTKKQKIALALKGAGQWYQKKSVARVVWNGRNEELPSNEAPEAEEQFNLKIG